MVALVVGLALGACGDDTTSDKVSQGDSVSAGDAGTAVATCATDLEPLDLSPDAPPDYLCDGQKSSVYADGPNACRNEADCDLIDESNAQKMTAMRQIAKTCALGCRRSDGDCAALEACNRTCISETSKNYLSATLSTGCADCYTQVAICGLEQCLSECADDPDTLDCVECSFRTGCRLAFERCTGLDRK
jgi:hypothetical protein